MHYHCNDCGKDFDYLKIVTETHGFESGPYERFKLCPFCNSTHYEEVKGNYCKCCGRSLGNSEREYCNASCRRTGEKLYKKQREKKEKEKTDKMFCSVREVDDYNRRTGKNLSYGQYFAMKGAQKI